jgi:hypothetical protein
MRPYLKKNNRKKGLAEGVGPEFKPKYCKQKNKIPNTKKGWQSESSGRVPA